MRWVMALLSAVSLVSVGGVPAHGVTAERVCRLPSVVSESSGLVVIDGQLLTINDSGDAGIVYVLDTTCAVVRTVQWAKTAVDVEALAPGPAGSVWVGDIGDNAEARASIELWLVDLTDGAVRTQRRLVYPDGPHDAEGLWSDSSGTLYVVTKGLLGGRVYRVPERGDQLRPLGRTPGLVTDAARLDDTRVLLRTYSDLLVFTVDPWREVARIELPSQAQGEALAVSKGELWLTSEGDQEPVLRLSIPREVLVAGTDKPSVGEPSASADASSGERNPSPQAAAPEEAAMDWRWLWPVGAGALTVLVWWMARRVRR